MAISIEAADVDLIHDEFELPRKDAEMKLRENQGNLKATLEALVCAK